MIIAVIDLGKTNSKVALVDTTQAQEIKVVTQSTTVNEKTPFPSLDHESIENFIFNSLSELAKETDINAITVTTHGATATLLDAQGELALPVLDYEFKDIDNLRSDYNKCRPSFKKTGSPVLPGGLNIGAQLYWLQKNYEKQFSKAKTLLTWPQYWVHLLTGEKHNDVTSLGCHTDLYEPHKQQYSSLVDAMQWRTLMPPTRNSGQTSGPVLPSVANRIGLSPSTPVHTGIHDSNASLVPHLISQTAPYTVVSTGTWFIAMAIGGSMTSLDETRDTLLNVNAYGEPVPSARFMGGRERELLGITTTATEDTLNTLFARESPPLLMPSVVPDTGPWPTATTHWINPVDNNVLLDGAVTLYLALMTNQCMHLIGSDGPTYIEGPLAHDQHFAQMLSVASKRPVFISGSQTGTSVGAAMLIGTPDKLPQYEEINITAERYQQMEHYAALWHQHLPDYAR